MNKPMFDGIKRQQGLRAIVRYILMNCHRFDWTLQGFGMLRLHLPDDCRLHVWDNRFQTFDVSTIHDHLQWGLHSTVISGAIVNRIYDMDPNGNSHMFGIIKPGIQEVPGQVLWRETPQLCGLKLASTQMYTPGDSYEQAPSVIHESMPENGTVTLIRKQPTADNSARIFWPAGKQWVSAEPRTATIREVEEICELAVVGMDKDKDWS